MRRLILLLSVIIMLTSCSVVKRTYVRDYGERIELIKTNFPEIYDDVYTYEKDGKERVGIHYHYR